MNGWTENDLLHFDELLIKASDDDLLFLAQRANDEVQRRYLMYKDENLRVYRI